MNRFFGIMWIISVVWVWSVFAAEPQSIVQINAYEYDQAHGSYQLIQQWSAVVLDSQTVITNAHVVTDEENEISYHYELCQTVAANEPPTCFGAGFVKKVLVDRDLAVVKFESRWWITPVMFADQAPQLGDSVKVLWYPGNGGETITQTEWRISGFDGEYYKIDANLDAWNSWWWAFDSEGKLIGIPTFVSVWYTTLGYVAPLSHVNELLYDTPVLTDSTVDLQFQTYLTRRYVLLQAKRLDNPFYTLEWFEGYGFEIHYVVQSNNIEWPRTVQLNDDREKTLVEVSTYGKQWDKVREKTGNRWFTEIKDEFDIAKRKTITYAWSSRDIQFLAGIEGLPEFKQLTFILRDQPLGLRYVISSTDKNTAAFTNALIMFLKEFTLNTTSWVALPTMIETFHEVLDMDALIVASAYDINEYGEFTYDFLLNEDGNQMNTNTVDYVFHHETSEFKEITYQEFKEYVTLLVTQSDLENMYWITVKQSFFARNSHGVLMIIQPLEYQDWEDGYQSYSVTILLENTSSNENWLYQYGVNLYAQDSNDLEQIALFLESLKPQSWYDHPFLEIGVWEGEIVRIDGSSFTQ